jgi:hypothetical protein
MTIADLTALYPLFTMNAVVEPPTSSSEVKIQPTFLPAGTLHNILAAATA